MNGRKRPAGLLWAASTVALIGHAPAFAQVAPAAEEAPASDAAPAKDEIIVSGSRVIGDGNNAPTPVTVVSFDQMRATAPSTIADALTQVPQFRASPRQSSYISPQASTGAFLNLRGLGANRNLVLFDGRRTVPTTLIGTTDINIFPETLIQRIDIVTGGASAAYGTDAVSGVVNFILDTRFSGIKAEATGGISSRSDGESRKFTLAWGTPLADDRVHLVGSFEYYKSDGVLNTAKRHWDDAHFDVIPNPTPNDGRPANLWRSNVRTSDMTYGGLIRSTALRGTQFLPGGATAPFTYGTEVSAATMVGGDGFWEPRGNVIAPLETKSAFLHGTIEASDAVSLFFEGAYANSKSSYNGSPGSYSGTQAFTIFNDNAFLPQTIRSQMATLNIASFSLGRMSRDWGSNIGRSDTQTIRGAVGFNADLGSWKIDGSYDVGVTIAKVRNDRSPVQTNVFNAVDAVISPVTGQPVCRSTLTNPGNGCVPLNLFGEGAASQVALDYILEDGYSRTRIRQDAVAFSGHGPLFDLPAGPVELGVGIEYRRLAGETTTDPISTSIVAPAPGSRGMPASVVGLIGGFKTGSQKPQPDSNFNVKEVYAEVLVPILKDQPLAQALDLNAAYRYADYSASGGTSSWKLGLTYTPVEDIRLRATRSRDVRAPNLSELYAPLNGPSAAIRDPVTGTNQNTPAYASGNSNLKPEIADTWTVGVVLRPSFIPRLSLSVDYYDIKIKGAIGSLSAQNTVNLCAAGQTEYCQFVTRLPDRTLVSVAVPTLNLNRVRARGVDVELNYRIPIEPGELTIRGTLSYLKDLATTDPFGTTLDAAGVNGGEGSPSTPSGSPSWQGSLFVQYASGPLRISAQERFISGGLYSNLYVEGGTGSNGIDFNHVAGRAYTDLTLSYDFVIKSLNATAFVTVNNLFDRDPPYAPSRVGPPVNIIGTNPTLYDMMGRFFNFGVRLKL